MLVRIAAVIFALTAILSLAAAYEAHQEGKKVWNYIARTGIYATLCIVFLSAARIKRRAIQADANASPKNPNDRNA
jgi:hypothetical protein